MQKAEAGQSAWLRLLHLISLGILAIAYPVLSVIQSRPQFLAVRGLKSFEIYVMVAVLCAAIPLLLFFVEWILGCWSRKTGRAAHWLFVALLFFLLVLPFLAKIGTRSLVVFPAGMAAGAVLALLYSRLPNMRAFVSFLAIALVAVPYNFLTSPSVSRALSTAIPRYPVYSGPAPKHSVVILILDELALVSLLDERNEIDEGRFPAFADLSRTATWYRNATTNADETSYSIPSIVTGRFPVSTSSPVLSEYPENILTYYSTSFRMNVFESFTSLALDSSRAVREESSWSRISLLMEDLSAIYLHLISPEDMRHQLPPVDQAWGGFWRAQETTSSIRQVKEPRFNRDVAARQMVLSLTARNAPSFNYLHLMLPHVPLEHLPSGRRYDGRSFGPNGADGQLQGDLWENQQEPVLRAFQRDLMQTMYADKVLGQVMQKLHEEKMFDDALLIVTADHGVSFIPGQYRRVAGAATIGDIGPVPLFIKYPNQVTGAVNDGNVELVDVAPTVGDAVGASLPWKTNGYSLLQASFPGHDTKSILRYSDGQWFRMKAEDVRRKLDQQLKRKLQLFGSGTEVQLYALNDPGSWIGKPLDSLTVTGDSPYRARLKYGNTLEDVDLSKDPLPCLVRGRIEGYQGDPGKLLIAVALNGKIEAITRDENVWNFPFHEKVNIFSAIVPESALRTGRNQVALFLMAGDGAAPQFRRIPLVP